MDISPRKPCKRLPEPVDDWLHNEGYFRKHAPRDPTCLFRAVSEQVYLTQYFHIRVRQECVKFMMNNPELFEEDITIPFDSYLEQMSFFTEWGSLHEIKAMSLLYECDFHLFDAQNLTHQTATNNGFQKIINLCHIPPKQYETVYPRDFITTAAFCQSIVYQTLYKDVFKMNDVENTVFKMLHDRSNNITHDKFFLKENLDIREQLTIELYNKAEKGNEENEESQATVKGITPFPYRVAKALDPNIYRNTDFDIWHEIRREIRNAGWMKFNSTELQVGGKCLVHMEIEDEELDKVNNNLMRTSNNVEKSSKDNNGNEQKIDKKTGKNDPLIFSGHIQEMTKNEGPVVVFIEELGEKKTVPFSSLKPLVTRKNKQSNWPLPHHKKNTILDSNNQKWKKSWYGNARKIKDLAMNVNSLTNNHIEKKHNKGDNDDAEHWENESGHSEVSNLSYKTYTMERFTAYQGYPVNTTVEVMPVSIVLETPPAISVEPMVETLEQEMPQSNENFRSYSSDNVEKPNTSTESVEKQNTAQTEFVSHGAQNYNRNVQNEVYYPAHTSAPQYLAGSGGVYYGSPDCNIGAPPQYFISNGMSYPPNSMDSPSHHVGQLNQVLQSVNFSAPKSMEANGSDLPLSDMVTVRFFYNLGLEYFRASYGWIGCGNSQPFPFGNSYIAQGNNQCNNPAGNSSTGNESLKPIEDETSRLCQNIQQNLSISLQREQANSPRDCSSNSDKCQNRSLNANTSGMHKFTTRNDFQNIAENRNSPHSILLQQSTPYSPSNEKFKEQPSPNKDNQRSNRNSLAPRFKKNFDGRCRSTRQQQNQQQYQQHVGSADSQMTKNTRGQHPSGNSGQLTILQPITSNPGCNPVYQSSTNPVSFPHQPLYTAVPYYPPEPESTFPNPYCQPNQSYSLPYIPHSDITDGNNVNHYPSHMYATPESYGQPCPVFPQYLYPPNVYPTITPQNHPENWYGIPGQTPVMGGPHYFQYSPPLSSMPNSPNAPQGSNVSK